MRGVTEGERTGHLSAEARLNKGKKQKARAMRTGYSWDLFVPLWPGKAAAGKKRLNMPLPEED